MSEEQRVATPFELGVCAALQVIGTAIASLDVPGRIKVADAAKALLESLPDDKSIIKDRSAHRLPLESLIAGLLPESSRKPSE
ncbi:hypothetical protein [Pseudomonas rustica]|uniref:Uncharacterized protein n=1 Tax=Pseudomonas rustica TaxID=2827099 RepID=A0ABS5N5G3_9PSED|nr:hypothetical protein [Pseudomonas rustica]MBS4081800.1 hypothetical protein [Pseudomonas rustica]MBS4088737.1 hypothetical protein [Pseudomonas rustica]